MAAGHAHAKSMHVRARLAERCILSDQLECAIRAMPYQVCSRDALQVRTLVQQEMYRALSDFDALVSPAAPTTAYRLGAVKDDPLEMYKGDLMTINVNLAGQQEDLPDHLHTWLEQSMTVPTTHQPA